MSIILNRVAALQGKTDINI